MTLKDELNESEREGFIKQIADKLFQGIQSALDKGEPRRWIWELVQNAKDVPNRLGPVQIQVTLQEKELLFEHNGDDFTIKSLTGLVQQVSDKSFRATEEQTTGKFGTGFITTHMLSKTVVVEGVFAYSTGKKKFKITLDREADDPEELLNKVRNLLLEKDALADDKIWPPLTSAYTAPPFETSFLYKLSPTAHKYAAQGVADLAHTGAFTLLFNKRIGAYTVIDKIAGTTKRIQRGIELPITNEIIALAVTVTDVNSADLECHTIAYFQQDAITLAIPVVLEGKEIVEILPLPDSLPRLFKDLPLIGTEDWKWPFVCNCTRFEPTEPRDGLFLHQEEEQRNWQATANKMFIMEVVKLAARFVTLLSSQIRLPKNLFLLCRSGLPPKETQPDVIVFLKEAQAIYRNEIKKMPLVLTSTGYRPMMECRFPFISSDLHDLRIANDFYQLCKSPFKAQIPVEDHYEQWLPIISEEHEVWGEKLTLSASELLSWVQGCGRIQSFVYTDQSGAVAWLNALYYFLSSNGLSDYFRSFQLLPNQMGAFIDFKDAQTDYEKSIPPVLKDAGIAFQKKYWDTLLLDDIVCDAVVRELSIEMISNELNTEIGKLMSKPANMTASYLTAAARICNVVTDSSTDERRLEMVRHLALIIPEWKEDPLLHPTMRTVYNFDPPLKAVVRFALYKISISKTLFNFREQYALGSEEKAIEWLGRLVSLLANASAEIKPLAMDFAVFPAQNLELHLAKELAEDVDSIPLFIKQVHHMLFPRAFQTAKLLWDGFPNGLVDNKYRVSEMATQVDIELAARFRKNEPRQDEALTMIDWLSEQAHLKYRDFFQQLERNKANIVLNSLPEKKEPVFRLLRLQPDFEKLTKIAESSHLDVLAEIAASNIDVAQLNRLVQLATDLGGVQQLEAIATLMLEDQADIKFRKELGAHVEELFRQSFSDTGENFEVLRDGFEHGQDFVLVSDGFMYRIEVKSFASGKERVHMSMRQGNTAVEFPEAYALCVLERPDPLSLADANYFKTKARFVPDIGVRLRSKVEAAGEIITMIKQQGLGEEAIDFDNTAYRFRIGKKIWENTPCDFNHFVAKLSALVSRMKNKEV